MRRILTRSLAPTVLVGALTLSACGGGDQATFEEPTPTPRAAGQQGTASDVSTSGASTSGDSRGDDSTGTGASGDAAGTSAGSPADGGAAAAGPTPVAWADAPRELTDVEKQFMFEPGPYSGDAYDEDKVVDAVLAMEPTTAPEWEAAITSQLQGDYVDDLKTTITFDPTIGDPSAGPTEAAGPTDTAVGTNHFALVLDASGSMGDASGSGTRMDEAKDALNGFVDSLPEGSTVSLRVYGNKGNNTDAGKRASCASSEEVFSGPVGDQGFGSALDAVEPTGWTPLARAIEDAAGDIPADATDGIVYVVTDGIETCGGDPVAAAQELAGAGIHPIVNVIGFQAGDADQAALRAIAAAGGGEYTQANSKADLDAYWDDEYNRMMDAWSEWRSSELERVDAEGGEKLATADEVGNRLLDEITEEGDRELDVATRLKGDGHLDYVTGTEVWNYFYGRKSDMWTYAYSVKSANWTAAYGNRADAWNDVYSTGSEKWTEYYAKKSDG